MNNIFLSNSSNETLNLWELLMNEIGSTWTLDSLYLYLLTPFSFFGVLLNLTSLIILHKIHENHAVYKYLKLYAFNGVLVCFSLIFNFVYRTPRYFDLTFSYVASLFRCKFVTSIFILIQFGNSVNICILLERISYFKPGFQRIFQDKPYFISLISLSISILTNLPSFFVYDLRDKAEFRKALESYDLVKTFPYCKRSEFTTSTHGQAIILVSAFINNFLYLLIEIVLTLISLVYLKKFFDKKQTIVSTSSSNTQSLNIDDLNQSQTTFTDHLSNRNQYRKTHRKKANITLDTLLSTNKTNQIISIMSLCMALLSIVSNLSSLLSVIVFIITNNGILFHEITFMFNFTAGFKYFSNFFLFILFNKNFRKTFLKLCKISEKKYNK